MTGHLGRRRAMALAAPSIVLFSSTSRAQELPQGTIRVLVGFPAGGGTDVMGRIVVDRLRERTGRNFVVENRAGAAGALAGEALKSAAPDGSTVLLTPIGAAVMTRLTFRRPAFDPVTDWAPIGLLGTFQLVLAVANQLGVKTVAEFVAWAKANPKQASFGTTAVGSLPHFFGVMFGRAAGFDFQPVPYRGAAPLLQDLVGGQVPAGTAAFTDFYVHHQAGSCALSPARAAGACRALTCRPSSSRATPKSRVTAGSASSRPRARRARSSTPSTARSSRQRAIPR
jgi:tripartite-type tricarboxylate transporter receptor subunit TctC